MSARVLCLVALTKANAHPWFDWPGRYHPNYNYTDEAWTAADFCCFQGSYGSDDDFIYNSRDRSVCVSLSYEYHQTARQDDMSVDPDRMIVRDGVRCVHAGYLSSSRRRLGAQEPAPAGEEEDDGPMGRRLASTPFCDVARYCDCMDAILRNGTARQCAMPCEYREGVKNEWLFALWICIAIFCFAGTLVSILALVVGAPPPDLGLAMFAGIVGLGIMGFGAIMRIQVNGEYPDACRPINAFSEDRDESWWVILVGACFLSSPVVVMVAILISAEIAGRIASARDHFRDQTRRDGRKTGYAGQISVEPGAHVVEVAPAGAGGVKVLPAGESSAAPVVRGRVISDRSSRRVE